MVKIDNYMGSIVLSYNYLAGLVRYISSGCFGVAALNPDDKLHSFFRFLKGGAYNDEGVAIAERNGRLNIGLHITVLYGTNISAVSENLAHKVRFAIEEKTGMKVGRVTVFVDGIRY